LKLFKSKKLLTETNKNLIYSFVFVFFFSLLFSDIFFLETSVTNGNNYLLCRVNFIPFLLRQCNSISRTLCHVWMKLTGNLLSIFLTICITIWNRKDPYTEQFWNQQFQQTGSTLLFENGVLPRFSFRSHLVGCFRSSFCSRLVFWYFCIYFCLTYLNVIHETGTFFIHISSVFVSELKTFGVKN